MTYETKRLAAACALLALTFGTSAARADNKTQLAQSLFDEAKRLMAENDFKSACPKFAESQRLDPSGGTLLHLGICNATMGKTASAYAELNEAVSIARRDNRADRENVAKAHLAAIAPKLSRITIAVASDAKVPGLELTWNGTVLPEAQWGIAFPVDPGEQVVAASAPGRRKWTTRLVVQGEGQSQTVAIPTLPKESEAPPPVAALAQAKTETSATTDSTQPSSGSTQRAVGIGVGAFGLVALGVGGYFQLNALSLAKERDDAALAGDRQARDSKQDDASSAQTGAVIAGAIGIVGLATGITLFVTAPKGTPATTAGLTIAPLYDATRPHAPMGVVIRHPLTW